MFTGIIESIGMLKKIQKEGSNTHFCIESSISESLKIDQSVAHNGVCLTVTNIEGDCHWVTAIEETLSKSNLGEMSPGSQLNLERCMLNNGRFDGHIVQGHVDQVGKCENIVSQDGSWLIDISYDATQGNITVEKGSITVNGVSLTCFNSADDRFRVAIIPYTFDHTNFHLLKKGDSVNLEFDIIGKYVNRLLAQQR